MRECPKCKKYTLDVTGIFKSEENFLFRCWTCGFECDLIEAQEKNYPSQAKIIKKDPKFTEEWKRGLKIGLAAAKGIALKQGFDIIFPDVDEIIRNLEEEQE